MPDPVFSTTVTATADQNFGPSLAEWIAPSVSRFEQMRDAISQGLRFCSPAIVQSFNPTACTVAVQLTTNEKFQYNVNGPSGPLKMQVMPMKPGGLNPAQAILQDLPVVFPGGGGWSITFPIHVGDECLVFFSDTEIDTWYQSGGVNNNPANSRRHSLSDGFAFFAPRSMPRALAGISSVSMQIRNDAGTMVVDFNPGGTVTVTAPNVIVNASASVQINAVSAVTIKAPLTTIQGALNVTGAVTLQGKTFLAHEHIGVQTGSGFSGPVR
jgi:hypothetical protein